MGGKSCANYPKALVVMETKMNSLSMVCVFGIGIADVSALWHHLHQFEKDSLHRKMAAYTFVSFLCGSAESILIFCVWIHNLKSRMSSHSSNATVSEFWTIYSIRESVPRAFESLAVASHDVFSSNSSSKSTALTFSNNSFYKPHYRPCVRWFSHAT